jgi:hypothetical protein
MIALAGGAVTMGQVAACDLGSVIDGANRWSPGGPRAARPARATRARR